MACSPPRVQVTPILLSHAAASPVASRQLPGGVPRRASGERHRLDRRPRLEEGSRGRSWRESTPPPSGTARAAVARALALLRAIRGAWCPNDDQAVPMNDFALAPPGRQTPQDQRPFTSPPPRHSRRSGMSPTRPSSLRASRRLPFLACCPARPMPPRAAA